MENGNNEPTNKEYTSEKWSGKLCKTYFDDTFWATWTSRSISFILVSFNLVLKYFTIALFEWVGEKTVSQ